MKKKYADMWAAALRSGKYKQGRNVLRTNKDEFCCLGVLCDLLEIKAKKTGEYYLYDACACMLPATAQIEAGIKSSIGAYGLTGRQTLVHLNDSGLNFDQIATYIEQHWKDL